MTATFHAQSGKFLATVAQNIPSSLTSTTMQYWIENPEDLGIHLQVALARAKERENSRSVLQARQICELPTDAGGVDLQNFFRGTDWLELENDFENRILSVAGQMIMGRLPEGWLKVFDLRVAASNADIILALPPHAYVFSHTGMFCAHLAAMLQQHRCGERGPLLTDGCNMFYVVGADSEIFTVTAYFIRDRKVWQLQSDTLTYDDSWVQGLRVFAPHSYS